MLFRLTHHYLYSIYLPLNCLSALVLLLVFNLPLCKLSSVWLFVLKGIVPREIVTISY